MKVDLGGCGGGEGVYFPGGGGRGGDGIGDYTELPHVGFVSVVCGMGGVVVVAAVGLCGWLLLAITKHETKRGAKRQAINSASRCSPQKGEKRPRSLLVGRFAPSN